MSEKASTLLDFDADATDRLWDLMVQRDIGSRDRLKQSAATAGMQLELVKPAIMGDGKGSRRIYAGSAVIAEPGTVFIVLAHHEKVFTIWLRYDGTLTAAVESAVDYVNAMMKSEAVAFSQHADHALLITEELVKQYGHAPGETSIELANDHNVRIIGMLFAAIPATGRAGILEGLEMVIAEGICPALVCLLGKGREKGLSGVWPLLLPLAPYADAVLA
jgi:hypothetical protein